MSFGMRVPAILNPSGVSFGTIMNCLEKEKGVD